MLTSIFTPKTTLKIIFIHYLSNIIIGILLRKKAPKITTQTFKPESKKNRSILINSINKSISTLLMILGTVTFYMIVTYIITFPFKENILLKTITSGFLEITNGLNNLIHLNIYTKIKEIIAIAIISFGGLSIHTQIKAILEDTKINYQYFLKGRILHTLIGIILILIF